MNNDFSNPATPHPIDEGDLLALIEGVSIPAERAARLREALSTDPRLAELAALMRADREAVVSLPDVSAPSDLLDRVEAQLEREALVGLAHTEATSASDELRISAVVPTRKVWMTRRTGAPLAAAAAVALIAGGVLMMIPGKKPVIAPPALPIEPIAHNNNPKPTNTDLAHGDGPTIDPEVNRLPSVPDIAAKPDAPASDNPLPERPVTAKATISTEDLLLAASEGRLVLRVRADDQGAKARVDQLNANARSLRLDPLDSQRSSLVSQAFVDAFNTRPAPVPPVKPVHIPEPAPIAGGDPAAVRPAPPSITSETPPLPPTVPAPALSQKAYLAYVPAAAESLESLRKSMGTDALPAEWQVLPRAVSFEPPTDAASILWWTAPPAAWSSRYTVPVVVQHN